MSITWSQIYSEALNQPEVGSAFQHAVSRIIENSDIEAGVDLDQVVRGAGGWFSALYDWVSDGAEDDHDS